MARLIKQDQTSIAASSGGGSGSDLAAILAAFELDTSTFTAQNVILDDFNDADLGTKSNTVMSADALRLSGVNTSGTYIRQREQSINAGSVDIDAVYSLQAYAPKNTVVSSNTFKITGNVTADFPTSTNMIICKSIVSDGRRVHIHVKDSLGNIALLPISASSYNSGLDETSVTVTLSGVNTGLDLDLDVSSSNYNDQLRLCPFNHTTEVRAKGTGSYFTSVLKEGQARETIRISGEQFLRSLFSIAGSVMTHTTEMSDNGQYGVMIMMVETASNNDYHFAYSVNRGRDWTKISTTKSRNNDTVDEIGGNFPFYGRASIAVGNNGKAIWTYYNHTGFPGEIWGVYADLTGAPSTVTDIVLNAGTDGGSVTGTIFKSGSKQYGAGQVCIDPVDASLIAVLGRDTSNNQATIKFYTWTGASPVYLNTTSTLSSIESNTSQGLCMTGTSGAHKLHCFLRNGTSQTPRYVDETTPTTFSTYSVAPAAPASGANGAIPLSLKANGTYLVGHFLSPATTLETYYDYMALSGTSWTGTRKEILNAGERGYTSENNIGWSSTSVAGNSPRIYNHTMINNPDDAKHWLFVKDYRHGDGLSYPHLIEVKDITASLNPVSSTAASGEVGIFRGNGDAANQVYCGQSFNATSEPLTGVTFKAWRNGSVPGGSVTITARLQAAPADVPSGTTLKTATLVITDNDIGTSSSANAKEMRFQWSDGIAPTLTPGNRYAVLLSSSTTHAAGTQFNFISNSSSNITGIGLRSGDNTTWIALSGFDDFYFKTHSSWDTVIGNTKSAATSTSLLAEENIESQISLIDSNNAQVCFKKTFGAAANYPYTGHVYRQLLSLDEVAANRATMPALKIASYNPNNFDSNLVFSASFGNTASAEISRTAGTVSSSLRFEDRSGLNVGRQTATDPTVVTDAAFLSGQAAAFVGASNQSCQYDDSLAFDFHSSRAAVLEFEILPATVSGGQYMAANFNTSLQGGFGLKLGDTSSGDIRFFVQNSAGSGIAESRTNGSFISAGVYQVVRIILPGDGSSAPKIYKASSPGGTFTEATYAAQTAFTTGNTTGITALLRIGVSASGANGYDGRMGYFKWANGTTTFAYTGWYDQAPTVSFQAQNGYLSAKKASGKNGGADVSFYKPSISFQDSARVDSYDQEFKLHYDFGSSDQGNIIEIKQTLSRGSVANISALEGIIAQFNKAS